jgi:hypothetical protein
MRDVNAGNSPIGHVFISYRHEDSASVDWLQDRLEAAGIRVWRDKANLWPGDDWRIAIRSAITGNALVFLACFSATSVARTPSWQNEELNLAVEQLRLRPQYEPWLIPIRFDDCDIPDIDLGGSRTLRSIQRSDLFGEHRDSEAAKLVEAVQRILGQTDDNEAAGTPARPALLAASGNPQTITTSAARPATRAAMTARLRDVHWRRLVLLAGGGLLITAAVILIAKATGSPVHSHSPGHTQAAAKRHPRIRPFLAATLPVPADYYPVALAFSPDGSTLAAGGVNTGGTRGDTYEWNLATRVLTGTLHDPRSMGALQLAYNPSGTILAVGDGNGNTYLWDVAASVIIATLHEPGGKKVQAVAFSPGGPILATGDVSGRTYLWNTTTHARVAILGSPRISGVDSLAFMPGGTTLAAGGGDGSVHLWNLTSRTATAVLNDPDNSHPAHGGARSLAFSSGGTTLAVSDGNGHTYLWNTATYIMSAALADPRSQNATAVSLNPAGTLLAAGDLNRNTFLWDVATHTLIATLHGQNPVYALAFSLAGTTLATADGLRVDLWKGL